MLHIIENNYGKDHYRKKEVCFCACSFRWTDTDFHQLQVFTDNIYYLTFHYELVELFSSLSFSFTFVSPRQKLPDKKLG